MRIVLLGPPGAGKGTLAGYLKDSFKLVHISTGDMLREEMKRQSPLGMEVKKFVESGGLVPDEVITRIVEHKMTTDPSVGGGFLLDGFPRTAKQAEDLDRILAKISKPLDFALYMEASMETVVGRLTGRRVCRKCAALYNLTYKPPKKAGVCDVCGGEVYQRADDNEETIRKRMQVYIDNTKPILEYYRKQRKLRTVDANQDSRDIHKNFLKYLDEDKKPHQNKVA